MIYRTMLFGSKTSKSWKGEGVEEVEGFGRGLRSGRCKRVLKMITNKNCSKLF